MSQLEKRLNRCMTTIICLIMLLNISACGKTENVADAGDMEDVKKAEVESDDPWVISMNSILLGISSFDEPFINAFADGGNLEELKNVNSEQYRSFVNTIITRIDNVEKTGTDLDSYNIELKDNLNSLLSFASNISETVENNEAEYEEEFLLVNHILQSLSGWEEIDNEFKSYTDKVNSFLMKNYIKGQVSVDFNSSDAISRCINDNARLVLEDFGEKYLNKLAINAGELNVNYQYQGGDWDYALNLVKGEALELAQSVVDRYSGTMLESSCQYYMSFIDSFDSAIDYGYTASDQLDDLWLKANPLPVFKRNIEIFMNSENFQLACDYNRMWYKLEMFTGEYAANLYFLYKEGKVTIEEVFKKYLDGFIKEEKPIYEEYKKKGAVDDFHWLLTYTAWGYSEEEYEESILLFENGYITQEEYETKTKAIYDEMQAKIDKYAEEFQSFISEVRELGVTYGVDFSEYIE